MFLDSAIIMCFKFPLCVCVQLIHRFYECIGEAIDFILVVFFPHDATKRNSFFSRQGLYLVTHTV